MLVQLSVIRMVLQRHVTIVTVMLCICVMVMQGMVVKRANSSRCMLECYGQFTHSCNNERCKAQCADDSKVGMVVFGLF